MVFTKINNYILFGGGDLLLKIVQLLKDKNYPVLVVTSDRHFNEKLLLNGEKSFGEFLIFKSINYLISKDISKDDSVKKNITKNTMGLSFGAAWIFKEKFINLFEGKLLNLHGSRLPLDRGGGGFSWRIMRGDKLGNALIHQISTGIDTGDIIYSETYIFPEQCKIPIDFYKISIEKYFLFMKDFILKIENKSTFNLIGQPEYLIMYWPRLNTEKHGYINWAKSVEDLESFICAFDDPYKGAMTYFNDQKVRVKKVSSTKIDGSFHSFQSGIIYRIVNDLLYVSANSGTLIIKEILNEQDKNIIFELRVGDRFYTQQAKLDKALRSRVIYTPKG